MKYFLSVLVLIANIGFAQKYVTEKSKVSFFSEAVLENITATNSKTNGILNVSTQEFAFAVPIKEFQFEKSLMQEHFNEKYMESDRYPKATFTGKLSDFDPNSTATQNVTAKGKLTIHGVTKEVEIAGTIQKSNSNYLIQAKFPVKLVDYKITIPELLWQKVAEQVEVRSEFSMKPQ